MTPEEHGKLKNAYLIFLDLIKRYRIKEFGKIGLTHIPKTEIDAIPDLRLEMSIEVLAKDRVLCPIKKNSKEVFFYYDGQNNSEIMVVDCLKTAEEITTYKNSLVIEKGWLSVKVEPKGDYYILSRRNGTGQSKRLSKSEGDLVSFLIKPENLKKTRAEIVRLTGLRDIVQISNLKNVIRKKLEAIGFSHKETEEMLPTYIRGNE